MDLVTVTCLNDRLQMLLQAESISKFLNPCRHWVIVNDEESTINDWRKLLLPYYKNHQLELVEYDWDTFPFNQDGYVKQQFYKFDISNRVNTDYLILDSKNFFCKPCKVEDWKNVVGCGFTQQFTSPPWDYLLSKYENILNFENGTRHMAIQTPFVFDYDILRKAGGGDFILNKFMDGFEIYYSEFLFYSLLYEKLKPWDPVKHLNSVHHKTMFPDKTFDYCWDILSNLNTNYNIKVLGFHREFLGKLSPLQRYKVNKWVNDIGLYNFNHV